MRDTAKAAKSPDRKLFQRGQLIFKEGDRGDAAYMVEYGKVNIFKTVSGRRILLGEVTPWNIFGEFALLDNEPRMASAEAAEETVCYVLQKQVIEDMMAETSVGLANLIQTLLRTARANGEALAQARAELLERSRQG
ncbi:cyclic nucleotide-binding domain-containing protein [Telmatospirillum sp. J64-1]|uniref:cyclic nucleotide-binding domain-containing protein n=1 Tax=Telmatospirillum sp. J64-1 TaxID=2502183 RepID=UPI00163DD724|nr:cyclic nucleotide-binding domain-containing protein [Telmatospirillum sp. J64-1]